MADPSLAVIAGANRGIGLGVVKEMPRRGWNVIATARRPAEATALAVLAEAHPGRLEVLALDLNNVTQLDAFADAMKTRTLDAVLINGGVAGPGHRGATAATEAEIGALMFTNAIAPIRLARALAGAVRRGSGVIRFTSSVMGSVALNAGGHELYRASKAALNSLSRGLWPELRGRGLTLLSLHPGWVRTDMGGSAAPVSVGESARGMVTMLERERGKRRHAFIDYQGAEFAW
ncbi:MAG: SDR family oxidoreductase [Acetobacteraceae bacterium]|nr:SDR family oxidoreductase [Acetobacteraceae bacterium]